MKVLCKPEPAALVPSVGVALSLMRSSDVAGVGRVGLGIPTEVRRNGIRPNITAWDFLSLSLGVIGADQSCLRKKSPDGWTREIELMVALVDPEPWRPLMSSLEAALGFLSGDIWKISLEGGGVPPLTKRFQRAQPSGDCICLLSGGVDSLVGAINLVSAGVRPLFVSQRAKGDTQRQRDFVGSLGLNLSHLQLSHAAQPPGMAERSQRARSMMFLAMGVLAATSLLRWRDGEVIDLVIPENGFISLNVPLTPLRLGSLSTRTTHPYFLEQMQHILDATGMRVRLTNPYQFKTKGEMLAECRDQALLRRLVFDSTSCGRFARWNFQHCGRCFPCLVRRAAFLRWGQSDSTTRSYRFENLALPGADHRDFDDVRSVAYAVHKVRTSGIDAWSASAISSVELGDTNPYVHLAQRGLDELEMLLAAYRAL